MRILLSFVQCVQLLLGVAQCRMAVSCYTTSTKNNRTPLPQYNTTREGVLCGMQNVEFSEGVFCGIFVEEKTCGIKCILRNKNFRNIMMLLLLLSFVIVCGHRLKIVS